MEEIYEFVLPNAMTRMVITLTSTDTENSGKMFFSIE